MTDINSQAQRDIDLDTHLVQLLEDDSTSIADRGDMLLFKVAEHGVDCRGVMHRVVKQADQGRKSKKKAEAADDTVLVSE